MQTARGTTATRSADDATSQLQDIYTSIVQGGKDFGQVAQEVSECGSFKNGGDLGEFTFEMMHKEFSEVAFGLPVGGVSKPFPSASGIHIVLRTA